MITLNNVSLRRGAKLLLDKATVTLNPGEKVGLVGRNGAGKSTLFALLNGSLHEDGGDFSIPKIWRMAQVAQNMPETEETATDFVIAGDTSGSITLAAPALAGSTTLTLPATTGTMALTSQAVRQVVFTSTTSYASGSTILPYDNTIPQNTEGDQYMTATITPNSATSKLIIQAIGVFWTASADVTSAALFQDSTANALAVSYCYAPNANNGSTITINYSMTSGTTSATKGFRCSACTSCKGMLPVGTSI